MLEKMIKITNVIVDTIIVIGIIVLGMLLLTGYVMNNDFDDDNFYAFITAIITLKLFDKLENNAKKIGKEIKAKKES